ncbi:MAG: hypothetical protein E6560_05240 [Yersiniaceae bacterium]|nr:hypothetical protein [Yersiniaceae bacterium]
MAELAFCGDRQLIDTDRIILAVTRYAGAVPPFCRDRKVFKRRVIAVAVNRNTGTVFAFCIQGGI